MPVAGLGAARELAKKDGGGGGMFAQAKRQLGESKQTPAKQAGAKPPTVSKRVTPPKNRPTSPSGTARPASTGKSVRPDSARPKKK